MSRSANPKDPEALLLAFANMLNEFYGAEDDGTVEDPAKSTASQQADLELVVASEADYSVPLLVNGPWEKIEVTKPKGVSIQVKPDLYKKMTWLTHNVPKMSLNKITLAGLEAEVERMLRLYYRPE